MSRMKRTHTCFTRHHRGGAREAGAWKLRCNMKLQKCVNCDSSSEDDNQTMSRGDPCRQKEEPEDPASSERRRQQRWGSREEKPMYTGHYSQGVWALQQALVVGSSLLVALPAGGGGGGVFDGGAAT